MYILNITCFSQEQTNLWKNIIDTKYITCHMHTKRFIFQINVYKYIQKTTLNTNTINS